MIDIHSHILPGLDDGAPDLRTAIKMARVAVKDGVSEIIATPHCYDGVHNCSKEQIILACARLNRALKKAKVELVVCPGAELRMTPELIDDYDKGRVLTLGNADKAILLEMPEQFILQSLIQYMKKFDERGLEVILAHPERNAAFRKDAAMVDAICQAGASIQLTAGSITGKFGREIKSIALGLAEKFDKVYVATDCHNLTSRPPKLKKALKKLKCVCGEQAVTTMVRRSREFIEAEIVNEVSVYR